MTGSGQVTEAQRSAVPTGTAASDPRPSPLAVRLHRPSWLDLRLVIGLLLVLVSVLVGARIVAAADRTTPVWAVRSELAAGTALTRADLVVVRMRVSAGADRYLATARSPAGLTLTRDVGAGELLPAAALRARSDGSLVSVPVSPQHVPPTVRAGQRIDVYATTKEPGGTLRTERVLAGVPVQEVRFPSRGALSATAEVALVVRVPPESAVALVRALRSAEIDVTARSRP
ncbi:MAG TPA: SAF domain-containing protein [Mycobacteriales bacterium]|jgi:hypothetical protein|nr:hypothetical protein [Actinomycetota bacterium]HEV7757089.1 SAF domain-containing protein [Mycobacteriales bacterium]